jgi:hypothetical protein
MINLSEVTIEYSEVVPTHIQSPEFYVDGNGYNTIATLTRGDREIYVTANGEMDLTIPNIVNGELTDEGATRIRYAGDLFAAGINDDIQFHQFVKTLGYAGWETYRMNPWWEIWADHDPDGIVSDSDNFYDAIDVATALLFDDEYWEN